jgi:ABC-type Na+ efflux pump permease subunit
MSTQANQDVERGSGSRLDPTATAAKSVRAAATQALETHAERRQRLAERAKVENPARTDEEIEARLEQFGV